MKLFQASKLAVSATQKTKELTQAVNDKVYSVIGPTFAVFLVSSCIFLVFKCPYMLLEKMEKLGYLNVQKGGGEAKQRICQKAKSGKMKNSDKIIETSYILSVNNLCFCNS